jgi:hypothetical protein
MAGDGRELLEGELGAPPPAGVSELADASLADLAAAIHEAKRKQAKALAEAADRAVSHIPRLLRAPVRAIFR